MRVEVDVAVEGVDAVDAGAVSGDAENVVKDVEEGAGWVVGVAVDVGIGQEGVGDDGVEVGGADVVEDQYYAQ